MTTIRFVRGARGHALCRSPRKLKWLGSDHYRYLEFCHRAVCKGLNGSKIVVSTTWSPDNSPGSTVRVQVSYPFTVAIPFMDGNTLNFSSTSQLTITQ